MAEVKVQTKGSYKLDQKINAVLKTYKEEVDTAYEAMVDELSSLFDEAYDEGYENAAQEAAEEAAGEDI